MRRFAILFPLLLATCGPTLAPAHPLHFTWQGHCPPEDGSSSLPSNHSPDDYKITYAALADFCKNDPTAPLCFGAPGGALPLNTIIKIDHQLRIQFQYRSDLQLYRREDYWAGYTVCGDCEDEALTLSAMLADHGEGGRFMSLSIETTEPNGDGHASLLVQTSDHGMYEVGVADEPYPYRFDPRREATFPMDGSRAQIAQPGYEVHTREMYVDKAGKP